MKKIRFTKMHGIGNDFIILHPEDIKKLDLKFTKDFIKTLCHRNFGIGSDGILCIDKGEKVEFRYSMYNPDGSQAEMCGNGIRCYMKYLVDNHIITKNKIKVETGAGILDMSIDGDMVTCTMGKPKIIENKHQGIDKKNIYGALLAEDKLFKFIPVSMGNPHVVIYLRKNKVADYDVHKYGSIIESDTEIFPNKTNVEFIEKISDTEINMRVYERGSGETLACGTGACAAVVAGVLSGDLQPNEFIKVNLKGGSLEIKWSGDYKEQVVMKGPAATVFEGEYFIP